MPYLKPLPSIDSDSKTYWDGCKKHELLVPWCKHCKQNFFPPRPLCPDCLSPDLEWRKASGKGTVYSLSVVHQNRSSGFREEGPYVLAYVTLAEGVQMLSNVVHKDPYEVKIGMAVELFFEDATPEISIPKFKLAA